MPADADNVPVEVGVKFRAGQNGYITGLRFYKGSTNTGTHVGTLWSVDGHHAGHGDLHRRAATGLAAGHLATPVAVTANTTYVASYHAPNGHYA